MSIENIGELLRFGTDAECRDKLCELYVAGLNGVGNVINPKELKQFERQEEILEEQIYFAQMLLGEIQEACRVHNRAADLKKAIAALIEESSFER